MEPGFYLIAPVFAVAAFHLINRGVTAVRRTHNASRTHTANSAKKCSDWYMFFHCSSLTGDKQQIIGRQREDTTASTSPVKRRVKDSRPSLRSSLT